MLLDPRHLAWKYWLDRGDWTEPRSFTARHDEAIVAHVAAWPVHVVLPDRTLRAAHLFDWASDRRYPGAGLWLIRQMRSKTDLLIATGGTELTRRMLPVAGFRPFGEVCVFARPLRPLAQARAAADRSWRAAARIVRNSAWRWSLPVAPPPGWDAIPAQPDGIDASIWPSASTALAVARRNAAFYSYVLASPRTRYSLFRLTRHGEPAGYFCISHARHVARIADIWVASSDSADWCAGVRTACAAAARSDEVHEVSGWASTAIAKAAFARAGFRRRDQTPLTLFGNAGVLAGRELHIQMLDCDASFVAADDVCYLT
jgi:hypothetical protein